MLLSILLSSIKYQVTEVEDELMAVVAETQEFENKMARGSRPRDLMEAAIRMNPDRAEQALMEYARYGRINKGVIRKSPALGGGG